MVTLKAVVICTTTYSANNAAEDKVVEDAGVVKDIDNVQFSDENQPENLLNSSSTIYPNGKQLVFSYDCETTSGSHYNMIT